jgi:hypothetical protein
VDIATNVIRRLAGTSGSCRVAGDGGPALSATLLPVRGVAVSPDGRWVFVSDSFSTVRVVATAPPGGGLPTIHGVLGSAATSGAPPPLGFITNLAYDAGGSGTLYMASLDRMAVYALDVAAVVGSAATGSPLPAAFTLPPPALVAGDGRFASLGDGGPAPAASLAIPSYVALWPNPLTAWIAATAGGRQRVSYYGAPGQPAVRHRV